MVGMTAMEEEDIRVAAVEEEEETTFSEGLTTMEATAGCSLQTTVVAFRTQISRMPSRLMVANPPPLAPQESPLASLRQRWKMITGAPGEVTLAARKVFINYFQLQNILLYFVLLASSSVFRGHRWHNGGAGESLCKPELVIKKYEISVIYIIFHKGSRFIDLAFLLVPADRHSIHSRRPF